MVTYDLVSEPWIPCVNKEGERAQLGLLGVLSEAHELRALETESPTVDAAVFRLLLAVLHRCFGPEDNTSWRALRAAGRFDPKVVGGYLGQWRHRFDLFHDTEPFFQVRGLPRVSPNYLRGVKPARELIAQQSSYGGARELFEHRPGDFSGSLPPDVAARWLIALQAFDTGGLLTRDVSPKVADPTSVRAGLLCNVGVVVVQGSSLFETLLLNLICYPNTEGVPTSKNDAPLWEQDDVRLAKFRRRACTGWLDWLTWRSRRVELFHDDDGNVTEFILVAGTEVKAEPGVLRDPMVAYRKTEDGFLPVGFSEYKALWRDSVALYETRRADGHDMCPSTVRELRDRLGRTGWRKQFELRVLGQVPSKASIVLTRSESVPLPAALLEQPVLIGTVRDQIALTDKVAGALRVALFSACANALAPGERNADPKDITQLVNSTQAIPRFWSSMKSHFDLLVETLAEDEEDAVGKYQRALAKEAEDAFRHTARGLSDTARALKGSSLGMKTLRAELAKLPFVNSARNATSPTTSQQEVSHGINA